MDDYLGAFDIAKIMGQSPRGINSRAKREKWPFRPIEGYGGPGGVKKEYCCASLPDDVQRQISISEQKKLLAKTGHKGEQDPGLDTKELRVALAAADLVHEYEEAICRKKREITKAKKDFMRRYNNEDLSTYPNLYALLGNVSFQTIERWSLNLRRNNNDATVLVKRWGRHLKGTGGLSPEQEKIFRTYIFHEHRFPIGEAIRIATNQMCIRGCECRLHARQLRNIADRIIKQNYPQYIASREGEKRLNELCLPHVERDYDCIDVGDIVFGDGHVMNFECKNPVTGKPKRMILVAFYDMKSNMPLGWDISPSENTEAIKVALYRSILRLGKFPKVVYLDNGRAFRGKFFRGVKEPGEDPNIGLFKRLGIKATFARPYHAETKPIEGFFKIFGELERQAPSYTGTSIENKPARMKRGEVLHRKLYESIVQGRVLTIVDAHLAIADWIETEYGPRPQRGHLKGRCPLEVFDAGKGPGLSDGDKMKLRLLMAQIDIKRITRDGIKIPWSDERYYHADLFKKLDQPATVRYDWQDKNRIYVYDADGQLICEASPRRKVHPAAKHMGTEEDTAELSSQLEMTASLKKSVVGPLRELMHNEIIPDVRRQISEICVDVEANANKPAQTDAETPKMTDEQCESIRRHAKEIIDAALAPAAPLPLQAPALHRPEFKVDWESLFLMGDADRYEVLLECEARRIEMPMGQKRWMGMYEKSSEYERLRDYFEGEALQVRLRSIQK
jgi:putative transposase